MLDFIRPHKNVIDYELLPYHRFGASKYAFLGKVYELADFNPPTPESLARLQRHHRRSVRPRKSFRFKLNIRRAPGVECWRIQTGSAGVNGYNGDQTTDPFRGCAVG